MEQPTDICSFSHNPGGINNQKMAILGLFLEAEKAGHRRVALPRIFVKDQIKDLDPNYSITVPFADAFDITAIRDFAARWDFEIVDTEPTGIPRSSWDFFQACGKYLFDTGKAQLDAGERADPDAMSADFARSLVAKIKDTSAFHSIIFSLQRDEVRCVAQLRIEADWGRFADNTLKAAFGNKEDYAPTYLEIMGKVAKSLPNHSRCVYVVCDESALPVPKEEIRIETERALGIRIILKSDILRDLSPFSPLELSLLDHEVAKSAEVFVGLTNSTFSNWATYEVFARTKRHVLDHFIYNFPGDSLKRRTDDGMISSAWLATREREAAQ